MPIDTLKAAWRLQEDGTFSPEQAERIAETLSDFGVASATKEDLNDLEERLTEHIERSEEKIRDLVDHRHQEMKTFVMTRLGWAAGLLAVWITLLNYVMG